MLSTAEGRTAFAGEPDSGGLTITGLFVTSSTRRDRSTDVSDCRSASGWDCSLSHVAASTIVYSRMPSPVGVKASIGDWWNCCGGDCWLLETEGSTEMTDRIGNTLSGVSRLRCGSCGFELSVRDGGESLGPDAGVSVVVLDGARSC